MTTPPGGVRRKIFPNSGFVFRFWAVSSRERAVLMGWKRAGTARKNDQ